MGAWQRNDNETLRNSPAICVGNLALWKKAMGHDTCENSVQRWCSLLWWQENECVCGAVCGVCRCVWLWLWSWCCTWVMVMTHIKKIFEADCRCTSGRSDIASKFSVARATAVVSDNCCHLISGHCWTCDQTANKISLKISSLVGMVCGLDDDG